MFDYTPATNLEIYNATKPIKYNLSNVKVPLSLYLGTNDLLVNPTVSVNQKV
jgi:hypothetical protein